MGDLRQDKEEWRWARPDEEMEKNHSGRFEVEQQRRQRPIKLKHPINWVTRRMSNQI